MDLRDPAIANSVLESCEAHHGPVDVLINNAGIQYIGHTAGFSDEEEARILNVNFATPLRLMRGAAARMQIRDSGTIVNVSSVIGLIPIPWMIHYSSTKAALGAASESLRLELRGTGVQVLTVYPGSIATEMGHRSKRIYDHPMITRSAEESPERLSRQIRLGMEKKKARVIYPPTYRLQWILRSLMTAIIFAFAPRRPRGISSRWPSNSRENS